MKDYDFKKFVRTILLIGFVQSLIEAHSLAASNTQEPWYLIFSILGGGLATLYVWLGE